MQHKDESIWWQTRLEGEDNDNYHRRVLAFAKERRQGVKYRSGGGKDLGIRPLPSDQVHTTQTLVSILAIPTDWDCQGLNSFLVAQKWTDLEILQKKPLNRHCVRWVVQGPWKYSGLEETDDIFIHISKMDTRKPVGTKQTWYVEPPKRTCKFDEWVDQELNPEIKKKLMNRRALNLIVKRKTQLQGKNEKGLHEETPRVKLIFLLVLTPKFIPKN